MAKVPVFLINGFLESGKSEFLKFTMEQEYFQTEGKTLLILCEEGDVEFEDDFLRKHNTKVYRIQYEQNNPGYYARLQEEENPERVLIEWNGMWRQDELKLPSEWFVNQTITMFDTSTLGLYLENMKMFMGPMLMESELVICNRADGIEQEVLAKYHLAIRAMAPNAEIIFEGKDGEIRGDFSIELPYDLNRPSVKVENRDFGIFYIDSMDRTEKYDQKEFEFVGQVMKPKTIPQNSIVVGRKAITCCEADMRFLGLICKTAAADHFKNKDWVKVRGQLRKENVQVYGGEGPVIYIDEIVLTGPIEEPVVF